MREEGQGILRVHKRTPPNWEGLEMLKIVQARLQQYVNRELPDVQAGFRKSSEPEIKLPTSTGSSKNKRVPEKHLFLLY